MYFLDTNVSKRKKNEYKLVYKILKTVHKNYLARLKNVLEILSKQAVQPGLSWFAKNTLNIYRNFLSPFNHGQDTPISLY